MSTRLALTLVGTVVGAYFGYPQLGAMAGAMIGSAVDPTTIQGPRINESGTQTVAEGVPRTVVFGTWQCTGNVIQRGPLDKREVSESQGKGSTKIKSQVAYRTFAIGICEGPVAGLLRVWQDNKLVYDVRPGSGMEAESLKWIANKRFYTGDETQLPDPALELLDPDTTAHRGSCYMVFDTENVTTLQGAISQYEFEVAVIVEPPVVQDLSAQVDIPVYGGIPIHAYVHLNYMHPSNPNYQTNASVGSCLTNAVPLNGATPYKVYDVDQSCAIVGTSDISIDPSSWSSLLPTPSANFFTYGYYGSTLVCQGTNYQTGTQLYVVSGGDLVSVLVPNSGSDSYWYADNGNNSQFIQNYLWVTGSSVYLGVPQRNTGGIITYHNAVYMWPTAGGIAPDYRVNATAVITGVCATPGAHFMTHLGRDGKFRIINDVGVYKVYSASLALESSETLPFSLFGIEGFGVDGDVAVFIRNTSDDGGPTSSMYVRNVNDWSLISTYANSTFGTKTSSDRVIFTEDSVFIQCQDTVLRSEYSQGVVGSPVLLSDIVSEIYARCGLESVKYDVSELTDEVRGYGLASAGYTAADAVDALRMAYFFDKSCHDKKIYHPKRGKAVVKTLTTNDLTQIPESTRREQTSEIPYKLNVRYPNPDSGYAVLKETTGSTSPDRRTTGEVTLDVPVALSSDQAAQIADKQYKTMLAEVNGTVELPLMLDAATELAEADCVAYDGHRLRIEESEFADWSVKLTLKADRQSAYTSNVTGIPAPPPTLPESTIVGPTELAIIDGPARTDSEDDIGYLAAVTGALPPWYGAELQRSFDGGANYTDVQDFTAPMRMGVLLEDIASASEYFTDTTNVVKIQFYRSTAEIDSLTMGQFLSRQGVFALEKSDGSWEYMQGKDVEVQLDDSVHLSTLHRGIGGSGTAAHTAGARFVWLADAAYIPASSGWLGASLTHQATSFDESDDETTNDQTATYVGRSQTELAPAYLRLARSGSNVLTVTWVGRARFGNAFHPVQSRNFQGYRITFDDGSTSVSFDTTAETSTFDASAMGPSVTVSVVALNRITGAGPASSGTI